MTPHINEGDAVRMDIHQEVSSIAPPVTGAVDLVTNKREVTTSVLVADDSLLVLGGLIDNQVKDNVQKVPVLGDIPLLGNLFRYRTERDHQERPDGVHASAHPARHGQRIGGVEREVQLSAHRAVADAPGELADHAIAAASVAARGARLPRQSRRSTGNPTSPTPPARQP